MSRDNVVSVRLTDEEYAWLQRNSPRGRSQFLRSLIKAGRHQEPPDSYTAVVTCTHWSDGSVGPNYPALVTR